MSVYRYFPKDYIPQPDKFLKISEVEYYALKWPSDRRLPARKTMERMENEIWRPIGHGWPDNYFVSDMGRVKVVRIQKNGREIVTEIKGSNNRGTKRIVVNNGKLRAHDDLTRLVLKAFDPRPNYKQLKAIHIDNDKNNNVLSNLKWMTNGEAAKHFRSIGIFKPKLKTRNLLRNKKWIQVPCRFDELDVAEMTRLMEADISTNKIAEIFDTKGTNVIELVANYRKNIKRNELPNRPESTTQDSESN